MHLKNINLQTDLQASAYQKSEIVNAQFATQAGSLQSREGANAYVAGDALITGSLGEQWVVAQSRFAAKYVAQPNVPQGGNGSYQSRPSMVLAKKMAANFSLERSAGGDVLHGTAGDWLLQYAPHDYGVCQAARFAAVYAPAAEISATQTWLERAVIGLNLCPFAKAELVNNRIRYVLSTAQTEDELLQDFQRESELLAQAASTVVETTLIIHPHVLQDFLDYNDFLDLADAALEAMDLDGELQVASFHPHYQFEGTDENDISNYSNRAPYPTLHLLREASVEHAIENFPDTDTIYQRNIETLERIGHAGWQALWKK